MPTLGCPDRTTLTAFTRGDLAQDRFEEIASHILDCLSCQTFLEHFVNAGDTLISGLLRVKEGPELTPRPEYPAAPMSGEVRLAAPPQFELLVPLGRGGMGIVYRARDLRLNREVAVKLLQDHIPTHSATAARFLAEASITGQLQHPGIPPIHELGTMPNGRPFLAMKLIKGENLDALLRRRSNPAEERSRFVAIFEQICQAVGYAHAHGVIHRDLKPANVMVGAFGEVQVMDWGLAKLLPQQRRAPNPDEPVEEAGTVVAETSQIISTELEATQTGMILGTPAYMPPEQAGGEIQKLDKRSDVFGLGAILCVILTGKPPYSGKDANAVRLQAVRGQMEEAIARLHSCGAEAELIALCQRCLASNPDERPSDAHAVAKEIAELRMSTEERARQAELANAEAVVREQEERKRRRVWLGLAAALLLGFLTATGLGLWANSARIDAEIAKLAESQALQREKEHADSESHERQRAEAAEATTSHALYIAQMRLAVTRWDQGQIRSVSDLLRQLIPPPGKSDLRGFEWYYLDRLARGEHLDVFGRHQAHITTLAYRPDGRILASGDGLGQVKIWDAATRKELRTLTLPLTVGIGVGIVSQAHSLLITYIYAGGSAAQNGSLRAGDRIVGVTDAHGTMIQGDAATGKTLFQLLRGEEGTQVTILVQKADAQTATTCTLKRIKMSPRAQVTSLAFRSDGKWLGAGFADGMFFVWDPETGQVIGNGRGDVILHPGDPCHPRLSFSPDGKTLVTAGWNLAVALWDISHGWPTGEPTKFENQRGEQIYANHLAYSPNGKVLVAQSGSTALRFIELSSRKELATVHCPISHILSMSYSPDGSQVAVSGRGGVALVNPSDYTVHTVVSADTMIWSVAFAPDGQSLAYTYGPTVVLSDAQGKQLLAQFHGAPEGSQCLVFSPDNRKLVTGGFDQRLIIWDRSTDPETQIVAGVTSNLLGMAMLSDGKRLVLGGGDHALLNHLSPTTGDLIIHDLGQGQNQFLQREPGAVTTVAYSPDGTILAVARGNRLLNRSGVVHLYQVATGQLCSTLDEFPGPVSCLVFSRDGKKLAVGSGNQFHFELEGQVSLFDIPSGKRTAVFRSATRSVECLSFLAGDARLVGVCVGGIASRQTVIKIWDVSSGKEVQLIQPLKDSPSAIVISPDGGSLAMAFRRGNDITSPSQIDLLHLDAGHLYELDGKVPGEVYALSFSPDGKKLGVASHGGRVDLWDVATRKREREFTGHRFHVGSLAFSPDGKSFLAGGIGLEGSGWILWDVVSGQKRNAFTTHTDQVYTLSFSPDGKQFSVGMKRGDVRLCNCSTGQPSRTLEPPPQTTNGHSGAILCLGGSPDGKLLATGSEDHTVKVWDLTTGKIVRSLAHEMEVALLAWSPDGKFLATVERRTLASANSETLRQEGSNDTIRLWDMDSFQLRKILPAEAAEITALSFAPTDRTLLWATRLSRKAPVGELKSLDVTSGVVSSIWKCDCGSYMSCFTFTPDGKTLIAGASDGHVTNLDWNKKKVIRQFKGHQHEIVSLAISPDGKTVATVAKDEQILQLWHFATWEELFQLPLKVGTSGAQNPFLTFGPRGERLLVGGSRIGESGQVQIWRIR